MEACVTRIVAMLPLARAFALPKSARVSTAGAIRARYHGSTRRVLFKATSINLSQDARSTASEGESNCGSSHAPEYQRGTTGDQIAKPYPIAPTAVRFKAFAPLPPARSKSPRDGNLCPGASHRKNKNKKTEWKRPEIASIP